MVGDQFLQRNPREAEVLLHPAWPLAMTPGSHHKACWVGQDSLPPMGTEEGGRAGSRAQAQAEKQQLSCPPTAAPPTLGRGRSSPSWPHRTLLNPQGRPFRQEEGRAGGPGGPFLAQPGMMDRALASSVQADKANRKAGRVIPVPPGGRKRGKAGYGS